MTKLWNTLIIVRACHHVLMQKQLRTLDFQTMYAHIRMRIYASSSGVAY